MSPQEGSRKTSGIQACTVLQNVQHFIKFIKHKIARFDTPSVHTPFAKKNELRCTRMRSRLCGRSPLGAVQLHWGARKRDLGLLFVL